MPEVITTWFNDVLSIPDLIARGFTIHRDHPWDTIQRRRAAAEQLADQRRKYFSLGPPEYYRYPLQHQPPSPPFGVDDFTCVPFFTSIIVVYTVSSHIGIQSANAEMSAASSGLLLDMKQAVDLPSDVLELTNIIVGEDYIVKIADIDKRQ